MQLGFLSHLDLLRLVKVLREVWAWQQAQGSELPHPRPLRPIPATRQHDHLQPGTLPDGVHFDPRPKRPSAPSVTSVFDDCVEVCALGGNSVQEDLD